MDAAKKSPLLFWIVKEAFRDLRRSGRHCFIFCLAMSVGVGCYVGVLAVRKNFYDTMQLEAKNVLGADLVVESNFKPTEDLVRFLDTLPGEKVEIQSFSGMLKVREGLAAAKLVQVRAVENDTYPFYGNFVSDPETAFYKTLSGQILDRDDGVSSPYVVVDEGLLIHFKINVGDRVEIGKKEFVVAGVIRKVPGEIEMWGSLLPRVYIAGQFVPDTGLVRFGSRVKYSAHFKIPDVSESVNAVREVAKNKGRLNIDFQTPENKVKSLGRIGRNVEQFLMLLGFAAFLLGCICLGNALRVHLREKEAIAGILHFIGAKRWQVFSIFFLQTLFLLLAASAFGVLIAVLGAEIFFELIGKWLPTALKDWQIPLSVVIKGLVLGLVFGLAIAFPALRQLWRGSPNLSFRGSLLTRKFLKVKSSLFYIFIGAQLAFLIFIFETRDTFRALISVGATAVILAVTLLITFVALKCARSVVSSKLPFSFRQGIANLYRPGNQTLSVVLSLGLGLGLILSIMFLRETLLKSMTLTGGSSANVVLFDVQVDEANGVRELLVENGSTPSMEVPVVTMRLTAIKDRSVGELLEDPKNRIESWTLRREYRSTYRNYLFDTETITDGMFIENWDKQVSSSPIPVSLERGIAERLGVILGDKLVFNVQGVNVETVVGSIREVNWARVQPNFFVVFPRGVLETAPQFFIITTRVDTSDELVTIQRKLSERFPSVLVIDVRTMITSVEEVLQSFSQIVNVLSGFSVIAGLLVLFGALFATRYERLREGILLRIIGAPRRSIERIMFTEYWCLGLLAGLSGIVVAIICASVISQLVFKTTPVILWTPSLIVLFVVPFISALFGAIAQGRGYRGTALEVLRTEN